MGFHLGALADIGAGIGATAPLIQPAFAQFRKERETEQQRKLKEQQRLQNLEGLTGLFQNVAQQQALGREQQLLPGAAGPLTAPAAAAPGFEREDIGLTPRQTAFGIAIERGVDVTSPEFTTVASLIPKAPTPITPFQEETLKLQRDQLTQAKTVKDQARKQSAEIAKREAGDDKIKLEQSLRKDFGREAAIRDFNVINKNIGKINAVWPPDPENDNRGVIDQILITLLNKTLDETSVVRESEYDRTPEGQSFVQSAKGKLIALKEGGPGITDEFRDEIVAQMRNMAQSTNKRTIEVIRDTRSFTEGSTADWRRITGERFATQLDAVEEAQRVLRDPQADAEDKKAANAILRRFGF